MSLPLNNGDRQDSPQSNPETTEQDFSQPLHVIVVQLELSVYADGTIAHYFKLPNLDHHCSGRTYPSEYGVLGQQLLSALQTEWRLAQRTDASADGGGE